MKRQDKVKRRWGEKVKANIKPELEARRKKRQSIYNTIKKKQIKFKSMDEISWKDFRFIDKNLDLMRFQSSSIAVFISLISRADYEDRNKPVTISIENLCTLSGTSTATCEKAINKLVDGGLVTKVSIKEQLKKKKNKTVYTSNQYHVAFVGREEIEYCVDPLTNEFEFFPFFTGIVQSGCWRVLSHNAKKLYIFLRMVGRYDDYYLEGEGINYIDRNFDVVVFNQKWYTNETGISYPTVAKCLKELETVKLLKRYKNSAVEIYLRNAGFRLNSI